MSETIEQRLEQLRADLRRLYETACETCGHQYRDHQPAKDPLAPRGKCDPFKYGMKAARCDCKHFTHGRNTVPMTVTHIRHCDLCAEPLDIPTHAREIIGWNIQREAGGTNHIIGRTETGRICCIDCIRKLKAGVPIEQGSLGL